MSVYNYDTSIIEDLRRIMQDDRIHITPSDNLVRLLAQIRDDNIKFPVISITRRGWSLTDNKSHSMKFEGSNIDYVDDKYINIQMIPINIVYQLDVWSKNRLENDNIMREIIFYYSTHPTLTVDVPYYKDKLMKHNFDIFFDNDIEDNSDIVNHINTGEYFRQTITFYTDNAYLWKSSSRGPTNIDMSVEIIDANKKVIEDVSIKEKS